MKLLALANVWVGVEDQISSLFPQLIRAERLRFLEMIFVRF
jgi:hypothetical protein